MSNQANYTLDITGEFCPMTFVKAKLLIEKMSDGDIVEIRLKGREPLRNVPKSIAELGHAILALQPEEGENGDGIHRLWVRKGLKK